MRYLTRALFIISAISLAAFNINSARAQTLSETFFRSMTFVTFEKKPEKLEYGSGFFIIRKVGKKEDHVLLIIARHTLPPEGSQQSINARVIVKSGETPQVKKIDIPIVGKDGKFLSTVKFHPNPKCDVAVVNVTDTIKKENIQGWWIPEDLLVTSERLKTENITVGDEIFLLGYPGAVYDSRNVFPVLRTGVIATAPTSDFAFNEWLIREPYGFPERIDGFLIDAHVFYGSSGSVVILKQQPFKVGSDGKTIINRKKKIQYVLGIVTGSIPITESNELLHRLGLGVVYSANAIRETIEQLYR